MALPTVSGVLGVAGGIAGGMLLSRRMAHRGGHKVLGVQMPGRIDLSGVGRQIGDAGRQFGKLADEIRVLREKAEHIGGALS